MPRSSGSSKLPPARRGLESQRGLAILGVLIIGTIAMIILAAVLAGVGSSGHASLAQREQTATNLEAEAALSRAVTWFRSHSKELLGPYLRSNFYALFDRALPGAGVNDPTLRLPSRLRIQGASTTPILSNDPLVATAEYPITPGAGSFDAQSSFATVLAGGTLVRATLVDAIGHTRSGDYGDTDEGAAAPSTDFYPIWRIDVLTEMTSGVHLFAYLKGSLKGSRLGFYGQDSVQHDRACDSYRASDGPYGGRNRRAGCPLLSTGTISIRSNGYVYGSVDTKGVITGTRGYMGRICADFRPGCLVRGPTCQGASCDVERLGAIAEWSDLCPTDQGDLTVNTDRSLAISSDTPTSRCWRTVRVRAGRRLTLVTSRISYYFNRLVMESNARINIAPPDSQSAVRLYVNGLGNNRLANAQVSNPGERPGQFLFNYWSSTNMSLVTNSDMHLSVYAPRARVTITGRSDVFGSVRAKSLVDSGTGRLHFDESLEGGAPEDMTFRVEGGIQQIIR